MVPGPRYSALLNRDNGWGEKPKPDQAYTTGRMGNEWNMSNELFNELQYWISTNGIMDDYVLLVMFLPTAGAPGIPENASAYGHRRAKWNVQIRYVWATSKGTDYNKNILTHGQQFQSGLDKFLPCRHFYNYVDQKLTCAKTNDQWLSAYFSDISRMKAIKRRVDPNEVFRSRLLSKP